MKTKVTILLTAITLIIACKQLDIKRIMMVKTIGVTDITTQSANVKGKLINLGEGMNDYGVYYSTSPNAQDGTKYSMGKPTGIGEYSAVLENLDWDTKYYTRTYGTDGNEFTYGDEITFTTKDRIPQLTTINVTNVTTTTATSGGNITDDGGFTITARGVCYSTSQNPTVTDNHTTNGTGIGSYVSELTGLSINTIYYVCAYATNSIGTVYGNKVSFFTGCKDYDDNIYNTVTIGTQIWMAENLKTTHYPNGNAIPLVTDNTAWSNLGDNNTDDAYCYYDNSNSNRDTYGALYTYAAAKDACPTGWHLPTDDEWKTLEIYLGMSQSEADNTGWRGTDEGKKLKATSGWNGGGNGTDNYGFFALPGGYRSNDDGTFARVGYYGRWWSSTENGSSYAYRRSLYYDNAAVYRSYSNKSNGFSVRCVRDN